MAELKPAYLISGDDDAKIDSWRARVRARAEAEGGPGALLSFDAPSSTPGEVAAETGALTLDAADRYLMVDGVEGWKAGELDPLETALEALPPGTVLVLVARGKAPARLAKAVQRAGGELRECPAPKPWKLPDWAVERAREQGLTLDRDAARALVAAVGQRPARIVRELERLALAAHPRATLSAEDVQQLASGESSSRAYDLADALVSSDLPASLSLAEELVLREGRPGALTYPVVRRLRDVQRAAALIDAGVPEQRIGSALKMPPWQAKRTLAQARKGSRESLEGALCALADFEVQSRGGSDLDEETAFSLALTRAAS